jgi:hypothetical protein
MNSDFKDLISCLNRFEVKYLVVGGYAVMVYAEPRYTKDIDVFLADDNENLARFRKALNEFGFPLTDEAALELSQPNRMISIGRPPSRIDFLNELAGVDFEEAWLDRESVNVDEVAVPFIGLDGLIAAKRAAGRPQDLIDLEALEKARQSR